MASRLLNCTAWTRQVYDISYDPSLDGGSLWARNLNGTRRVVDKSKVTPEMLPDIIGKDLAQKLLDSDVTEEGYHYLKGDDLKVEATGMRKFYDLLVPQVANKILKPFGQKIEWIEREESDYGLTTRRTGDEWGVFLNSKELTMNNGGKLRFDTQEEARSYAANEDYTFAVHEQRAITITPEMRAQITENGLPLFSAKRDKAAEKKAKKPYPPWKDHGYTKDPREHIRAP